MPTQALIRTLDKAQLAKLIEENKVPELVVEEHGKALLVKCAKDGEELARPEALKRAIALQVICDADRAAWEKVNPLPPPRKKRKKPGKGDVETITAADVGTLTVTPGAPTS